MMEKTWEIREKEIREEIAQEIEAWGFVTSYDSGSEVGLAQDAAFRQARSAYAAIARGEE
jgi:hypothetical protein